MSVGCGVPVGSGTGIAVGCAVAVAVCVGVGVSEGTGVAVGLEVGVSVGCGMAVGFGIDVAVAAVDLGFRVLVGTGVAVAEGSGVGVAVRCGVAVGSGITVAAGPGVGVPVGSTAATGDGAGGSASGGGWLHATTSITNAAVIPTVSRRGMWRIIQSYPARVGIGGAQCITIWNTLWNPDTAALIYSLLRYLSVSLLVVLLDQFAVTTPQIIYSRDPIRHSRESGNPLDHPA